MFKLITGLLEGQHRTNIFEDTYISILQLNKFAFPFAWFEA